MKNTLLVNMFEKVIESSTELTTEMQSVLSAVKKNTEASNKLLNHLSCVPKLVKQIRWLLIPMIGGLLGLLIKVILPR